MSTHVVDRIEAVRFPKEIFSNWPWAKYLVCELGGDNNCRNSRNGRRAKDWSATAIGEEYHIIYRACELAASCSGGMTKLRGRLTKPESYIRAYRKALANAVDYTDAQRVKGLIIAPRIRFKEGDDTGKWHYDDLITIGRTPKAISRWGENFKVFEFDLDKPEEVAMWLGHCFGPVWNCAEIFGPDTN
jgi:hypothetical protein